MKKLALLFGLVIATTGISLAYIEAGKSSDIETLHIQGFSTSALEAMDTIKYLNQGSDEKYVRRFAPKKHKKIGKGYQQLKSYFDPIQDDGQFAQHQINFSNTWQGQDTRYSSDLIKNEDL